ncbi:MAG: DUF4160 domain-containing protein [Chitinivibrionia bacterium]|nr:DUF4160 domain-containing protein [Chitinivibrionia bacterium]
MPTISRFYGILIRMYKTSEHNPPHFHAIYGEYEASFDLNGDIISGNFPPKQARFVKVWAEMRQDDLLTDWSLAIKGEEPEPIEPLK